MCQDRSRFELLATLRRRTETHVTATLKDVAQRAGVSIKTVSNVVHNYVHVTEEVRKRVHTALEELNYQPNLPARYLRNGHVGVLALAIPDLSNPYFSDIGNAIIAAASSRSYTVLIDRTGGERANESLVLDGLRPHLIDGVILIPFALEPEDLQSRQMKTPLVLLGDHLLDIDVPYDHLANSNVAAARLATNHLLHLGRRRIAAIGKLETLSIASGAGSLRRLRGYTQALAEAGRRIPDDVAVIGFDNIEEARFAIPSLTTIAPDKEKIGELAVSFLLGRIDGTRTSQPDRVEVPFRLIVRESTGGLTRTEEEIN
jgi:DNA-binding LacI/PurR family transcriptional regulator